MDVKSTVFLAAILGLLILFTGSRVQAQELAPLTVSKGSVVILKIPGRLLGFERVSFWNGTAKYGAIIEKSQKGLMVGGIEDWQENGWPLMTQLYVQKVTNQGGSTLVELKGVAYDVNLRFSKDIPDVNVAFQQIAFSGTLDDFKKSDYYEKTAIEKVLPQIFSGKLSGIPNKSKLRVLEIVKYIDRAVGTERYKGDSYLSIDVGGDTEIYNTIRVTQQQRIEHCLNQRVLSYLKLIARAVKFADEIDGVKISILVPYKNFVTEAYADPSYDRVDLYTPMDALRQFADDDLASDEVVTESILLVNGNRTRLSEFKSL